MKMPPATIIRMPPILEFLAYIPSSAFLDLAIEALPRATKTAPMAM
jgi:hypothetical protein